MFAISMSGRATVWPPSNPRSVCHTFPAESLKESPSPALIRTGTNGSEAGVACGRFGAEAVEVAAAAGLEVAEVDWADSVEGWDAGLLDVAAGCCCLCVSEEPDLQAVSRRATASVGTQSRNECKASDLQALLARFTL